jgi:hypothetical protein
MGLEPAVLKALAKRPKDRWKDATEFKLALRKAEEQTIRESIPYQAYNIKTDRVPTDRVPYPATDRFKEKPQQPAVREAKGKTAIRIRARPEEVVAKVSYRAQFIGLYEALRKAAMYLLSFVIYLVILVAVAFVVYTGYPKVKGILYPPPHVSLSVVRVALEADLVAVSLTGDAEFCKKFGKLEIETTIVGTNYQKLTIGSPPNFLSKTSDGTFADFKQVTIKSQDQPITHTAYLPFDAYLQNDLQRPFRIRVRIFNGDGHLMSTFFTAPKQLAPDELPATDPVSPTES